MSANGWLISLFLYYNLEFTQYVLWIGRINFAMFFPMLYYLLKFAFVFPREVFPFLKKINTALKVWFLIMIILTIFTPLVAKEEIIVGPGQRKTIYGSLYPLYIINYFVFTPLIITLLLYKVKKLEKKIEKLQIKYVLTGLGLAMIFGFITNIFFPFIGFFDFANYGPLATFIFVLFVTILCLKNQY